MAALKWTRSPQVRIQYTQQACEAPEKEGCATNMDIEHKLNDVDVVHPELYSKCRLCIEEVGQIRTLPAIQEKIKFCFDIMVMPNDYLPQLLCTKCNNILANYCELKKKYIENQRILQFKLNPLKEFSEPKAEECTESALQTPPDVENKPKEEEPCILTTKVTESLLQINQIQEDDIENETENLDTSKSQNVPAKDRCGSSNSNASNGKLKKINKNKGKRKRLKLQSDSEDDNFTTRSKNNNASNRSWKSIYLKKIMCRFCSKNFQTKRSFDIHLGSHSELLKQYDEAIKQHCVVTLNKVDSHPNITGSLKNVAVSNDTIIRDTGNSTYYHCFIIENGNISEAESIEIGHKRQKRKRLRLDSDSSTDIESKQSKKSKKNSEPSKLSIEDGNDDIQCINLDDTSSDTFDSSSAQPKTGKEYDLAVINSIINTYYNKYKKGKREDNDVMLCRKLLSTGRKIMSGHGIQAPGLVKYIEQKNLAISWYPINTRIYEGMKTNYVRIITKIREKSENNILAGWNVVKVNEDLIYDEESEPTSAELIINPISTIERDTLLMKLLNANPVANPKQLPKKVNTDIQMAVATTRKPNVQHKNSDEIVINLDEDNDNMLMPVIMSTESLANQSKPPGQITETVSLKNKENNKTNNKNKTNAHETSNSDKDRPFPRIKCKPVSELMPTTSHNFNNVINANIPLVVTQPVITINPPLLTLTPTSAVSQYTNNMTPIIDHTILQPVLSSNSIPTISVISQQVNNISQQDNPLECPAVASTGVSSAMIQLPDSVIQINGSAPSLAGVVSQPVSKQQLPPWSRGSSVPAANANHATPVIVKEEKVQPSTALSQTASTPVPPTPAQRNTDTNNPPNQTATPDSSGVLMNSVYLPNMITTKPIEYFKNVLIMHDLILLIEPNLVLSEGFACLVKYKLGVQKHTSNLILGLALFVKQNQFCIKVRNKNLDEMDIITLGVFWQIEILKSFLGEVTDKILKATRRISPVVHNYSKQFLNLLKNIELQNFVIEK